MVPAEAGTLDPELTAYEWSFVAMGCECNLVLVVDAHRTDLGAISLCRGAVNRIGELDAKWSRFRQDSEITALNTANGNPVRVTADTVALVDALVDAWRATAGAFDPTLLPLLVAGGYSRSRRNPLLVTKLPAGVVAPGRPGDIVVRHAINEVTLPRGTTLDPGGLGKGLAADLVAAELMAQGAAGVLVDLGGDLRVMGSSPQGDAWRVTLEADDSVVVLRDGGVATSSRLTRARWDSDAAPTGDLGLRHDLLNPFSSNASDHAVTTVSAVAGTAAWAEAMTKLPFVLGRTAGLSALEQRGVAAAVWTDSDGDDRTNFTDGWLDYLDVAE